MDCDGNYDMRIRQLEKTLLRQEIVIRELRTEIEAIGDVLKVSATALEATGRGSFLTRLLEAAEVQRDFGNRRAARAIETLVTAARHEG